MWIFISNVKNDYVTFDSKNASQIATSIVCCRDLLVHHLVVKARGIQIGSYHKEINAYS